MWWYYLGFSFCCHFVYKNIVFCVQREFCRSHLKFIICYFGLFGSLFVQYYTLYIVYKKKPQNQNRPHSLTHSLNLFPFISISKCGYSTALIQKKKMDIIVIAWK